MTSWNTTFYIRRLTRLKINDSGKGASMLRGFMTMLKLAFGSITLISCTVVWLAPAKGFQEKAESKKESKQGGNPSSLIDLKIRLEGVTPLPEGTSVELKGLEDCAQTGETIEVKSDSQVTFHRVPACRVTLKIFISGMDTGIVQVDTAKYRDKVVRIQMKPAEPAKILDP